MRCRIQGVPLVLKLGSVISPGRRPQGLSKRGIHRVLQSLWRFGGLVFRLCAACALGMLGSRSHRVEGVGRCGGHPAAMLKLEVWWTEEILHPPPAFPSRWGA